MKPISIETLFKKYNFLHFKNVKNLNDNQSEVIIGFQDKNSFVTINVLVDATKENILAQMEILIEEMATFVSNLAAQLK